jgi:hypothetical protein
VFSQEPVKGVANPDAIFTDQNAKLNTNKQAAVSWSPISTFRPVI